MIKWKCILLADTLKDIPDGPGVYLLKDKQNKVIYVGKAKSLKKRLKYYFQPEKSSNRIDLLKRNLEHLDFILVKNEMDALLLEATLIKKHKPYFNVRLKDDKKYPWINITAEPFPRIHKTRMLSERNSRRFGPYTDVKYLDKLLDCVQKLFGIRTCSKPLVKPVRPCLQFQLSRCCAPCTHKITSDAYRDKVEQACAFLQGKTKHLIANLTRQMQQEAAALNFEHCAQLKQMLELLTQPRLNSQVVLNNSRNEDYLALVQHENETACEVLQLREGQLIAEEHFKLENKANFKPGTILAAFIKDYYSSSQNIPGQIIASHIPMEMELLQSWLSRLSNRKVRITSPRKGDKKALLDLAGKNALAKMRPVIDLTPVLQAIKDQLKLEKLPQTMEAYDISNLLGKQAYGSMVTFTLGLPDKTGYRSFKIKNLHTPDDYGMLMEVLRRRFSHATWKIPDLILIDGGKGQLQVARQVAQALNLLEVDIISLAKAEEIIFSGKFPRGLALPHDSPVLLLLMRLRDEAHRFALKAHIRLRNATSTRSFLDNIPGLGQVRKKNLLSHFGSLTRLRQAGLKEISALKGIGPQLGKKIFICLHQA